MGSDKNINSYKWNDLYDRAEKYLEQYSDQFYINRDCGAFVGYPEVEAAIQVKGNKNVLKALEKDPHISVKRGFNLSGARYAKVRVRFQRDGSLPKPENKKEPQPEQQTVYTTESALALCETQIRTILHQHDMDVSRNDRNRRIYEKIMEKCREDLSKDVLTEMRTDAQIRYFVEQTILYLVTD